MFLALVATLWGCDDDRQKPPPPLGTDFIIYDIIEEEPPPPEGGPQVLILSPLEATEKTSERMITRARFAVECQVLPHPVTQRRIDKDSIVIEVSFDGQKLTAPGQPTPATDIFRAEFTLPTPKNGEIRVRCSAADIAQEPLTSFHSILTFVDLGPIITIFNPIDNTSYGKQVNVYFRVEENPVSQDDPGAAVDDASVKAFIGTSQLVDLSRDEWGNYVTSVVFDDPDLFPVALDGRSTLRVVAANRRGTVPVTRTVELNFIADSSGSVIEFVTPKAGDLIGGVFRTRVKVTDSAGVDPNSVIATIANTYDYPLLPVGSNEYEGTFDSRNLSSDLVYPLMVVRARDAVGNQSSAGQIVALDTRRPLVDLDPYPMREVKKDGNCSILFDPLGPDAPSDGEAVPQLTQFRVRVEDQSNGASASSTGLILPMAGVNAGKVQLFILDDATGALVVDTDGDGICDDINPLLKPTSVPQAANEAAVINMVAIDPKGSNFFPGIVLIEDQPMTVDHIDFGQLDWLGDGGCTRPSGGIDPPDALCEPSGSALRIIRDSVTGPAIYAIPPLSTLNCTGNAIDLKGSNIAEGWACVAVRAEDNLGNVGVSPPMRICVDADNNQDNGCTCTNPHRRACTAGSDNCGAGGLCIHGRCWNPLDRSCSEQVGLPNCTGVYDRVTNTILPGSSCVWPKAFRPDNPSLPYLNMRRND